MEYKKINLRDFRHNLTQVRESGLAYTVLKKGEVYGYFIPSNSEYKVNIVKKQKSDKQKSFEEVLKYFEENPIPFKDEVSDAKDAMEAYHRLLDIKYNSDE